MVQFLFCWLWFYEEGPGTRPVGGFGLYSLVMWEGEILIVRWARPRHAGHAHLSADGDVGVPGAFPPEHKKGGSAFAEPPSL